MQSLGSGICRQILTYGRGGIEVTEIKLNPCRFCGHAAEADHLQGYRSYSSGNMDYQAAIYCTSCSATMTLCRADTPELDDEERMALLLGKWNCLDGDRAARIDARNQALEEAAQIAGKRVSMAAGTAMSPSAVFNLFGSIPDAIRAMKDKTDG